MEKIFEGIPFEEIKQRAEFYKEDIYKFTRDLVRCPGGSGDESLAATCTIAEMQKLGFNKIDIDPMGNILAYIGTGFSSYCNGWSLRCCRCWKTLITGTMILMKVLKTKIEL